MALRKLIQVSGRNIVETTFGMIDNGVQQVSFTAYAKVVNISGDKNELIPALATRIVDKVGGGDAVFAISAMLSKIGAPISVIGFVSNIVAAHEISQIGHGNPMSLGDIKKHAKALLA